MLPTTTTTTKTGVHEYSWSLKSEHDPPNSVCKVVRRGDSPLLKHLLGNGESPDLTDSDRTTPLNWAAQKGHLECMRILLDAGAKPNGLSHFGRPAILDAASNGHLDCVKLLIEYGADPTIKLHNHCGPLHFAVMHGHVACVEELIKCVSISEHDRNTALSCAMLNEKHDCVQVLWRAGAVPTLDNRRVNQYYANL